MLLNHYSSAVRFQANNRHIGGVHCKLSCLLREYRDHTSMLIRETSTTPKVKSLWICAQDPNNRWNFHRFLQVLLQRCLHYYREVGSSYQAKGPLLMLWSCDPLNVWEESDFFLVSERTFDDVMSMCQWHVWEESSFFLVSLRTFDDVMTMWSVTCPGVQPEAGLVKQLFVMKSVCRAKFTFALCAPLLP